MAADLYLFFIAALMLNLTPGNDMIFVATRSISQGSKAGIVGSLGVFVGCFIHIGAAILGLSVIIANSFVLFTLIKFAGAAYLVYLGLKSFFAKPKESRFAEVQSVRLWKVFKQGLITNALNPKVAIFFLSFLPQFIDPSAAGYKWQLLLLGLWFSIQGTLILIIVSLLVGRTAGFFKKNYRLWRLQEKITGAVLIFLGIKLAFTGRK